MTTAAKVVRVKDPGGNSLKLLQCGNKNVYYPTSCTPEGIKTSHSHTLRPDDIILCSYPKAGSHWIWNIVRMLLDGEPEKAYAGFKDQTMLDLLTKPEAEALPSPRFFSTHLWFCELPSDVRKKQCRVVFAYRNLKDSVVSHYHMVTSLARYDYKGKFDDFLSLYLDGKVDGGSYIDYMKHWDHVIQSNEFNVPFLVVCYENLIRDPLWEIGRLSRFLGKDHDEAFLESVRDASTFRTLKARKGKQEVGVNGEATWFRKGVVGDWKDYLTVARNEQIDQVILKELNPLHFNFVYEL